MSNTYDYPILSALNLTCNVTSDGGSLPNGITYRWNTAGCYRHNKFTGNGTDCFPNEQINQQTVTDVNLNAEDAGTIRCTATINDVDYTSASFTLRISGEQLAYCVIACIVYYKQCMLLLFATCYCCMIHQLLWFMYRGVFIVGIVLIQGYSDNVLPDYSYVNARDGRTNLIVRCFTGLGPSGTDPNDVLGGLYFNGNMITNPAKCTTQGIIQVEPGTTNAGILNIFQCAAFTIAAEGVYTCALMNSTMMNESMRFGIYFSSRSESLDFV